VRKIARRFSRGVLFLFLAASWARNSWGSDWLLSSPIPTDRTLFRIAADGDFLVAVGAGGTILTSTIGGAWIARDSPTDDLLVSVAHGPAGFVAISYGGTVLRSARGVTWESISLHGVLGVSALSSLAVGPSGYVVCGFDGNGAGIVLTSGNAVDWSRSTVSGDLAPEGVCWAGTKWIGVAPRRDSFGSVVFASADGAVWAPVANPNQVWLDAVEWNGSQALAVGKDSVATSTDGVSWEVQSNFDGYGAGSIVWSGDRWIVAGIRQETYSINSTLAASSDGKVWTDLRPRDALIQHVAVARGRVVAVGGVVLEAPATIEDSGEWVAYGDPSLETFGITAAHFDGRRFFVGGGGILESPDGIGWKKTSSDGNEWVIGMASNENVMVAVRSGCGKNVGCSWRLESSRDGFCWTSFDELSGVAVPPIVTPSGFFVFGVTEQGRALFFSSNGFDWVEKFPQFNSISTPWTVVNDGARFIAYGIRNGESGGSHVETSSDGLSWQHRAHDAEIVVGVAAAGGGVVVGGGQISGVTSAAVLTTHDGQTFIRHDLGDYSVITGLVWTGLRFLAIAQPKDLSTSSAYADLLSSPDGDNWTFEERIPPARTLAIGNGRLLLGGSGYYTPGSASSTYVRDDLPEALSVRGRSVRIIPAAAHSAGGWDTRWRTDLVLHDSADVDALVRVWFLPRSTDGSGLTPVDFVIPPGRSILVADVLRSLFGLESAAGVLALEAPSSVVAISTTVNEVNGGRTGDSFAPADIASMAECGVDLELPRVVRAADLRTNLDLVNASDVLADVSIEVRSASGTPVTTLVTTIPPWGNTRLSDPLGSFAPIDGSATLRCSTESSRVLAVASIVDNPNGDFRIVPAVSAGTVPLLVPAVARARGATGNLWTTQLDLVATDSRAQISLVFRREDGSTANAGLTLQARESARIDDLVELFVSGETEAAGFLEIHADAPIAAACGISSPSPIGTVRQSIAISPFPAATADPILIGSVRTDSGRRTNLAVGNAGNFQASVTLELHDTGGELLAKLDLELRPHSLWRDSAFELWSRPILSGFIRVVPRGLAELFAWGSIVDAVTGDPVFVPGVGVGPPVAPVDCSMTRGATP